jgi:hypothetical protein
MYSRARQIVLIVLFVGHGEVAVRREVRHDGVGQPVGAHASQGRDRFAHGQEAIDARPDPRPTATQGYRSRMPLIPYVSVEQRIAFPERWSVARNSETDQTFVGTEKSVIVAATGRVARACGAAHREANAPANRVREQTSGCSRSMSRAMARLASGSGVGGTWRRSGSLNSRPIR